MNGVKRREVFANIGEDHFGYGCYDFISDERQSSETQETGGHMSSMTRWNPFGTSTWDPIKDLERFEQRLASRF